MLEIQLQVLLQLLPLLAKLSSSRPRILGFVSPSLSLLVTSAFTSSCLSPLLSLGALTQQLPGLATTWFQHADQGVVRLCFGSPPWLPSSPQLLSTMAKLYLGFRSASVSSS